MKTLVLLAALAALATAQFRPYNPISVEITNDAPLNIPPPVLRPAAPRPAPRPAAPPPRPAPPATRAPPPPPPPPPVVLPTTSGAGSGAGGLFGAGAGGSGSGSGSGGRGGSGSGGRGSGGSGGAGGAGFGSGGFGGSGGSGDGGAGAFTYDVGGNRGPPITVSGSLRSGTGSAAPRNTNGNQWVIIKQSKDQHQSGYQWNIETENGIGAREDGDIQNPGTQNEAMLAKGYYEFTAPDGILYHVDYIADDYGFRAIGAHLPAPPPIPAAILRALEYNRLHPEQDNLGTGGRFARK